MRVEEKAYSRYIGYVFKARLISDSSAGGNGISNILLGMMRIDSEIRCD